MVKKHPDAVAWDEWIDSEEGKKCRDATTLGSSAYHNQYLQNRLWRAFMAGCRDDRSRKTNEDDKVWL